MTQQLKKLRLIMVVCLILSTFSSLYSQVIDSKQYNYVGNWYNWQGGRFINNLNIPKVQATTGRDTGAIRYALADSSVYVWTGSQWRQVAGSGGSSYTFSNGTYESGGTVKAGGVFETDSISYISNSSKIFRIQSRTAAGGVNLTDALFGPTISYIKVIGASASIYTSSTLTSSQIEHKSTQTDGTTTDILIAPAGISLRRYGVAVSRMLKVASTIDFSNSAGTLLTNSFGADSSIHYKKLVYGANYRSLFTPFTLADVGYVDSLAATKLSNITGLVTQGWNTKLTGSGTAGSPYVISVDTTTQTLTDGATVTFDANAGVSAKVTLGGNRTLAFSNFHNGMFLSLAVIQDGTGSRTLTLPTCKVIDGGAGAVTLTTAASSHDILTFWKINDVIYCNYGKNYN